MVVLKCKMCGGDLVLTEDCTVAECEYCGTRQTVPASDSEKKMNLFSFILLIPLTAGLAVLTAITGGSLGILIIFIFLSCMQRIANSAGTVVIFG